MGEMRQKESSPRVPPKSPGALPLEPKEPSCPDDPASTTEAQAVPRNTTCTSASRLCLSSHEAFHFWRGCRSCAYVMSVVG